MFVPTPSLARRGFSLAYPPHLLTDEGDIFETRTSIYEG